MAQFGPAIELVFRHEGGYVWNKNDPGGPTKYGITLAVLSEWRKQQCTADDVKNMLDSEAKDIYKAKYWTAIQGDAINTQDVASWCFDMAVLRGTGGAIMSMQQALGVTADGALGPKSLSALNMAAPPAFLNTFRSLCMRKFLAIVGARPTSLEFLPGWVKRADEMSDTVSLLLQKTAVPFRLA